MHENSNNSILNQMYNTLHNQNTIKFYYKPGLKHYYYYFCVYSNKYYCLLKQKECLSYIGCVYLMSVGYSNFNKLTRIKMK